MATHPSKWPAQDEPMQRESAASGPGARHVLRAALRLPVALGAAALVAACAPEPAATRATTPAAADAAIAPLPAPSGRYAVGSILLDVDDPRPLEALPEGMPRVVEAQVWYPAARDAGGERMPYFPRAATLARFRAQGYLRQPAARFDEWARYGTHAERGALPAPLRGGFPLLLFTPSPPVPVQHYSALLGELASRGFVVLAVEPRVPVPATVRRSSHSPLADMREPDAAADLSLVLRQFIASSGSVAAIAQRADLTRAGVFSHLGGAGTMLDACTRERVLQRCAAIDGVPPDEALAMGVPRPLLVLRSGMVIDEADLEAELRARWLILFAQPGSAGARLLRVDGSGLMSATDAPWVMPEVASAGGADGEAARTLELTASLLAAFFGADGEPLAEVDSVAARYPEVRVES